MAVGKQLAACKVEPRERLSQMEDDEETLLLNAVPLV